MAATLDAMMCHTPHHLVAWMQGMTPGVQSGSPAPADAARQRSYGRSTHSCGEQGHMQPTRALPAGASCWARRIRGKASRCPSWRQGHHPRRPVSCTAHTCRCGATATLGAQGEGPPTADAAQHLMRQESCSTTATGRAPPSQSSEDMDVMHAHPEAIPAQLLAIAELEAGTPPQPPLCCTPCLPRVECQVYDTRSPR
jgi:hypothetical protein